MADNRLVERRTREAEETRSQALARWLVITDDWPDQSRVQQWRKVRETKIPVGDGRMV